MVTFPPERQHIVDSLTGKPVIQWTASPANDQHLYFTCPSVTEDDRWLVIISEREGSPNLYAVDRDGGRIVALTSNRNGLRRSYCYPWGGEAGMAKSTPCLHPGSSCAYAVIDDAVWKCDLNARATHRLAALPERGMCGFTHVSPDGRYLCVPLADDCAAFGAPAATQGQQMEQVFPLVLAGRLRTRLWLFDTQTGAARLWAEAPFWVTHVQFDPSHPLRAIFNSEGHWQNQKHVPRIWCCESDGSTRPLFQQAEGEVCGHENFSADGSSVVYHGRSATGEYLARRRWDGSLVEQLDSAHIRIHHATPDADGRGYLCDAPDGVIYRLRIADGRLVPQPLCRHDTTEMFRQDHHAHPILNPDRKGLIFSSSRGGSVNVYELRLDGHA